MARRKIWDKYYISVYNQQIEVSEPLYRMYRSYIYKEQAAERAFFTRNQKDSKGNVVHKPSLLVSLDEDDMTYRMTSSEADPLEKVMYNEQRGMLKRILDELEAPLAEVIYLLFFEQYTECEIARILNVCQATVSNRKHKALRVLREQCDALGLTISDFDLL